MTWDTASAPLADYFWIAGIESISYPDAPPPAPQLGHTIDEDGEAEAVDASAGTASRARARHSRQNSATGCQSSLPTAASPSSTWTSQTGPPTVTAAAPQYARMLTICKPGAHAGGHDGTPAEFDFDRALMKFAVERENFLDDLSFSAGAKVQARPPMVNPRAERLRTGDGDASGRRSPLRDHQGEHSSEVELQGHEQHEEAACRSASRYVEPLLLSPSLSHNSETDPQPLASLDPDGKTTEQLQFRHSSPEPLNTDPDMHPLKRRFEPILLDRYPPRDATDEISRRGKFPDYVPMFSFPNDIQIVSSDDRPRSTWHGFTMTSDDNSKIYGITIILWTALDAEAAQDVERAVRELEAEPHVQRGARAGREPGRAAGVGESPPLAAARQVAHGALGVCGERGPGRPDQHRGREDLSHDGDAAAPETRGRFQDRRSDVGRDRPLVSEGVRGAGPRTRPRWPSGKNGCGPSSSQ